MNRSLTEQWSINVFFYISSEMMKLPGPCISMYICLHLFAAKVFQINLESAAANLNADMDQRRKKKNIPKWEYVKGSEPSWEFRSDNECSVLQNNNNKLF